MSQKATQNPTSDQLTSEQLTALERLVLGDTVASAALDADVVRETVHRWLRNPAFQAALNASRADLRDAARRRLLATAEAAASVVDEAVRRGDVKVSLAVLRGLGYLAGSPPAIGSSDASELAEEERISAAEARDKRGLRSIMASIR